MLSGKSTVHCLPLDVGGDEQGCPRMDDVDDVVKQLEIRDEPAQIAPTTRVPPAAIMAMSIVALFATVAAIFLQG
jgi:hypothetical protein